MICPTCTTPMQRIGAAYHCGMCGTLLLGATPPAAPNLTTATLAALCPKCHAALPYPPNKMNRCAMCGTISGLLEVTYDSTADHGKP